MPRGDLAAGERPVREVVERPLAEDRLVDRVDRPSSGSGSGQCRVTVTSIALLDDSTIRPTTSISPSRRTSSARAPVDHGRTGLVDVVAVAPRADVALRVERVAAQRARRPAGADDPRSPARRTTGPRRRSSGRAAGRARPRPRRRPRRDRSASPSSSTGPRASTSTSSSSPSQPSVSEPRPERLVERLVERSGVVAGDRRVRGGRLRRRAARARTRSSPRRSARTATWTFSSDDADDPRAVAGLEEEGAVARLADGAGHESVGWVEEIAASRHARTLYRNALRADVRRPSADVDRDRVPAARPVRRGRRRLARSGPRRCRPWPGPGSSWPPGVAVQSTTHWTHVASEIGVRQAGIAPAPSIATSTREMPRSGAQATPAMGTCPAATPPSRRVDPRLGEDRRLLGPAERDPVAVERLERRQLQLARATSSPRRSRTGPGR